ncbi:MAG TPA: shikimate kinase, partial [Methanocella sp.]|nr:shikimate kinase [Methanocella sp.]
SGAKIRTTSDIPIASGLKSSSAAANATVIATCRAVQQNMDPLDMIRIGVHAALDAGVSVTGAFDDACASMLGGVVVTDNRKKTLIKREALKSAVIVYAPDKKSFSAHTNVKKSRLIAPWVEMAFDLAIKGEYGKAMGLNGFLYCSALGYSTEPMLTALEKGVAGVSLSGTGPSYVALVSKEQAYILKEAWSEYPGRVFVTEVINEGAFLR